MRYNPASFLFCLLMIIGYLPPAHSLELFGVNIETTDKNLLRNAIKQAGAKLIREGGLSNFYDIYDSRKLFENSERLYTGFTKESGNFAFLEYQFPNQHHASIQKRMEKKYGPAEYSRGTFLTDGTLHWQIDNIRITLRTDFYKNKSRLIYEATENLKKLNIEFSQKQAQEAPFY